MTNHHLAKVIIQHPDLTWSCRCLLLYFALRPDRLKASLADLQQKLGVNYATLHCAISQLVRLGLMRSETVEVPGTISRATVIFSLAPYFRYKLAPDYTSADEETIAIDDDC